MQIETFGCRSAADVILVTPQPLHRDAQVMIANGKEIGDSLGQTLNWHLLRSTPAARNGRSPADTLIR